MDRKIKSSVFGYKKSDVTAYIEEIVASYEKKIADLTEACEEHKKENKTLVLENKELFLRIEALEKERDFVSQAVISAQKQADDIIEQAKKEAENLKAATNADLDDTRREIEQVHEQLNALKLKAVAAIRDYEDRLEEI